MRGLGDCSHVASMLEHVEGVASGHVGHVAHHTLTMRRHTGVALALQISKKY